MNPQPIQKEVLEDLVAQGKKLVVLMTYNYVDGFSNGVHDNVVVFSYDRNKHNGSRKDVARDITDQFYETFNLRQDADMFEHIFVYAGQTAVDEAIRAARMIGHDWKHGEDGKKVTLVCCDCGISEKRRIAHQSYSVNMILCECGGDDTMGRIAKQILAGKDPKEISDYAR